MSQLQILRVVVASPSDVLAERNAIEGVAAELNQGIAEVYGKHIVISRWETDAYPSFHPHGPQGVIDSVLHIEDCDLVIGIFWKRFGTPTVDAKSGTEHEFRKAYEAWQNNGRPQIMIYFNQRGYAPQSKAETDQWGEVLEFKREFPREGLWWPYNGKAQFEKLARNHITKFILRTSNLYQKDLDNSSNNVVIPPTHKAPPIEEQIEQWIQAKASNSTETLKTYQHLIKHWRSFLHKHGLDLNSVNVPVIVSLIQEWANMSTRGTAVSSNTYNNHISSIRSFYSYALMQGWIQINPIETVELRKKRSIKAAQPFDVRTVKNALKSIPRSTWKGKRDYALLCILFTTGMRPAEIAGLRCGHVAQTESGVTITTRQKGGCEMRYMLYNGTAQALIDYLAASYDTKCDPDDPVWISSSRNNSKGSAISKGGISGICDIWLHETRVEATKRTYEKIKNVYGEKGIEEIEKLLGISVIDLREDKPPISPLTLITNPS